MIPLVIVACVLGVLGIVAAVVVGFRSRLAISVLRDELMRSNRELYIRLHSEIAAVEDSERKHRKEFAFDLIDRMGKVSDDFRDRLDAHIATTAPPDSGLNKAIGDLVKTLAVKESVAVAPRRDVRKEMREAAELHEANRVAGAPTKEEQARRSGLIAPTNRPKEN
jgi:hypothetical protein